MERLAKQGPTEIATKAEKAMSRLDELTESMKAAVDSDSALGKTLKFDLKGEGFIYVDGGSVTNEDRPAGSNNDSYDRRPESHKRSQARPDDRDHGRTA